VIAAYTFDLSSFQTGPFFSWPREGQQSGERQPYSPVLARNGYQKYVAVRRCVSKKPPPFQKTIQMVFLPAAIFGKQSL
jgi:hypothetical protein